MTASFDNKKIRRFTYVAIMFDSLLKLSQFIIRIILLNKQTTIAIRDCKRTRLHAAVSNAPHQ